MPDQPAQAAELPSVTLIILNWNAREFLPACLHSLLQLNYPHFKIVVVDNASDDGSVELVSEQFPQVQLIQTQTNRGYAYGNNVALRRLDSDFALLINPDVVVEPDWLHHFLQPVLADDQIGVAGCKLTYPDGVTIQHTGGYLTRPQAFPRQNMAEESFDSQTPRDVEYIIGAAMLIRKELLAKVGLLDDGYFLYFEDADFCTRARRSGYRVVYVPTAQARHFESATTQRSSHFYFRHMFISRWRYLLKHLDFAMVLSETVPAESEWLVSLPAFRGSAAAHAYQVTLKNFPGILRARQRDGLPLPKQDNINAVQAALQQLRQQAWLPVVTAVNQLASQGRIQTRPFVSHLPIIGPLIAGLRQLWNRVETEAYVQPLLAQQNEYNQQISQQLALHVARLLAHETAQTDLTQELLALQTQIKESYRHLHLIQVRLERLKAVD